MLRRGLAAALCSLGRQQAAAGSQGLAAAAAAAAAAPAAEVPLAARCSSALHQAVRSVLGAQQRQQLHAAAALPPVQQVVRLDRLHPAAGSTKQVRSGSVCGLQLLPCSRSRQHDISAMHKSTPCAAAVAAGAARGPRQRQ